VAAFLGTAGVPIVLSKTSDLKIHEISRDDFLKSKFVGGP
jgi:hypothetical protein